jgi:hypothetical protein
MAFLLSLLDASRIVASSAAKQRCKVTGLEITQLQQQKKMFRNPVSCVRKSISLDTYYILLDTYYILLDTYYIRTLEHEEALLLSLPIVEATGNNQPWTKSPE